MKQKGKFIDLTYQSVSENMKKDLWWLETAIKTQCGPVLRIYGWEPAGITLGRNQTLDSINLNYCRSRNIEITNRPTGGRAVYHQGDISYCFIIRASLLENSASIRGAYKEISSALLEALKLMGIASASISESNNAYTKSAACMAISTGADLEYQGKKLAGSAQFRKQGYVLQHGSILIEQDFSTAAHVLGVQPSEMNCVNVSDIINPAPGFQTIAGHIKTGFEACFEIKFDNYNA